MKDCICDKPIPHPNPRRQTTCARCGYNINPEWSTSDETVGSFFDRLAESLFHHGPDGTLLTPKWWEDFRAHCEARERAGRGRFGFAYLTRDNPVEACEEAADGAMYMFLDGLRSRREGWDEEIDVALTAAHHFALAHRYCRMLSAKRRCDTGPGMDE